VYRVSRIARACLHALALGHAPLPLSRTLPRDHATMIKAPMEVAMGAKSRDEKKPAEAGLGARAEALGVTSKPFL
jgi:hypothetical protein